MEVSLAAQASIYIVTTYSCISDVLGKDVCPRKQFIKQAQASSAYWFRTVNIKTICGTDFHS